MEKDNAWYGGEPIHQRGCGTPSRSLGNIYRGRCKDTEWENLMTQACSLKIQDFVCWRERPGVAVTARLANRSLDSTVAGR